MAINLGGVMAEVVVDIGNGEEVAAAVTRASVERMGIAVGESVVTVIKATGVTIGRQAS